MQHKSKDLAPTPRSIEEIQKEHDLQCRFIADVMHEDATLTYDPTQINKWSKTDREAWEIERGYRKDPDLIFKMFYRSHQKAYDEQIINEKLEAQIEGREPELWEIQRPDKKELQSYSVIGLQMLINDQKKIVREYKRYNADLREKLNQGKYRGHIPD